MSEFLSDDTSTQKQPESTNFPNPDLVVGHSGDIGLERPVREFDNTTLREAEMKGLLLTPEHPGNLTNTSGNKKKNGLLLGGGAAILLAASMGYMLGNDEVDGEVKASEPILIEDTAEKSAVLPEKIPPVAVSPSTTEHTSRSETSYTLDRVNGDTVTLKLITDEDIRNGQAVHIIKNVSSLYITTGDEELLNTFVDTDRAVASIDNWEEFRSDLGMDEELDYSPNYALKFNTTFMVTELLSNNGSSAEILVTGGLYLHEYPETTDWEEFVFLEDYIVNSQINADEQFIANFAKKNDNWVFVGYTLP